MTYSLDRAQVPSDDDFGSDDAMSVSYADDAADPWEWDEVYWCYNCGRDVLLGMELREGRVWGTCEHCQERHDYTPPDDDVGRVLAVDHEPRYRTMVLGLIAAQIHSAGPAGNGSAESRMNGSARVRCHSSVRG